MKEILAEELNSEEVWELLERLNARDLGGSEYPTLGAIVEATEADPVIAGRLLAEIRQENYEQRFGFQLQDHEERIDILERKSRRFGSAIRTHSESQDDEIGYQKTPTPMNPIGVVLTVFIGILVLVLVAATKEYYDKKAIPIERQIPFYR